MDIPSIRISGTETLFRWISFEAFLSRGKLACANLQATTAEAVERSSATHDVQMRSAKQRFSRLYSQLTKRFETFWAERFTSVLVEDALAACLTNGRGLHYFECGAGRIGSGVRHYN